MATTLVRTGNEKERNFGSSREVLARARANPGPYRTTRQNEAVATRTAAQNQARQACSRSGNALGFQAM